MQKYVGAQKVGLTLLCSYHCCFKVDCSSLKYCQGYILSIVTK